MEEKIVWLETIRLALFNDLSKSKYETLIKNISIDLQYGITQDLKSWATVDYLNELIILFISKINLFENPTAVFFALLFKYGLIDKLNDYHSTNMNIEFFQTFMNKYGKDFDIERYSQAAQFLIINEQYEFNDMISQNDLVLFNDIIMYFNPIDIVPNVRVIYFQPETSVVFQFNKEKFSKEQIDTMMLPRYR